jgi:hypothetical protein
MITQESGWYGILNDYSPNNTFKEWRYLESGTECDDCLVLPRFAIAKPIIDPKIQKLFEVITIFDDSVLQDWEIQDLTQQEIEANKRPDPVAFMREGFAGSDEKMRLIYNKLVQKAMQDPVMAQWFNLLIQASQPSFFTIDGFHHLCGMVFDGAALTPEERDQTNFYLRKYDLPEVIQ